MNLSDLIADLDVRLSPKDWVDVPITAISEDSRQITPGSIFIARAGVQTDGSRFIPQAIRAGASAIITSASPDTLGPSTRTPVYIHTDAPARVGALIAERLAGNPSQALAVAGITGTNGKSTVAWLIHQLCTSLGLRCGLIGTVINDDGDHATPSSMTTPPAQVLSPLLASMRHHRCGACAMEVSSHGLDQDRTAGVVFTTGVFTNLTGDHLDYHKTMANYAAAKARLFAQLAADAWAIVNADDPACETMLASCRARVITCQRVGAGQPPAFPADESHARVRVIHTDASGMELELAGLWGELTTRTQLIGAHNAMNLLEALLASWVCLHKQGVAVSLADLAGVVPTLRAPTGRLEPVVPDGYKSGRDQSDITVLVDFAHTDDALAAALGAARSITPKGAALWAVFGAGGNKDRTKRPRMGTAAALLADRIVLTSDNPRSEDPQAIIDDILKGIDPGRSKAVLCQPDRAVAIARAIADAKPGDVILIAGKGHEQQQELPAPDGSHGMTIRIPFSDHEHARAALARRHTRHSLSGMKKECSS